MTGVLALAFLLSFCSLGYQLAIALALSDASGDFVLSQALSLGTFLLGMGAGSWWCGQRKRDTRTALLKIEWALALSGFLAVTYVQAADTALNLYIWNNSAAIFALVLPYALMIGYWTGFELPLLLQLGSRLRPGHILAAHYAGAFVSTLAVPLGLLPVFDATGTAQVLGVINFVAASGLLARTAAAPFRLAVHLALGLFILGLARVAPVVSEVHLKSVYFAPKISAEASLPGSWNILRALEPPLRLRSAYQWIDLLPAEFSGAVQGRQDFQVYMDRKLQVSAGSVRRYHESMVHGGINLLGRIPNRVLILGGGDGLLANELLSFPEVARVDLVELDPQVLHLARTQSEMKSLNGGALNNGRVHVQVTDAFHYVRHTTEVYDLILIDLPFPNSYDLSLLYTKEFYALIRRRLAPDGVALLDFPLPRPGHSHLPTLVHTLRAAGYDRLFAFGTEDFFVAAASRPLGFDFATLLPRVSNQTLTNLISRASDLSAAEQVPARINTVLFPLRFGGYQ